MDRRHLFAVNFCYLGIAAFTGVAGTIVLLTSPKPPPPSKELPKRQRRTAIIIAIYQEKPSKVIAAAEAMWDSLKDLGAEKGFEVFFMSDTMDPALVEIEEQAMQDLMRRRADEPFWYRRRRENTQKKQGNINDFVQRWGAPLRLHARARRRQPAVAGSDARTGAPHGCASAHGADPDAVRHRRRAHLFGARAAAGACVSMAACSARA